MSTTTKAAQRRSETRSALSDTMAITRRNLTRLARTPDSIIFGIAQSVMFVLLFRFVFGGAISVPGDSYVDFLMGGIFAQTIAFSCATTTVAMAVRSESREDMAAAIRAASISPFSPAGNWVLIK